MNRIKWRPIDLTAAEFFSALAIKIVLGSFYGYIYLHFYEGDDTWKIVNASIRETRLLLDDPLQFFKNEYTPLHSIHIAANWKEATLLYLNDLQYALLVKSFAFVNLLTQGNYYLNVICFNLVAFWGNYILFVLLNKHFPGKRNLLFLCIFFFLPSLFWLSGIRIEGLLFLFLALYLRNLAGSESRPARRIFLASTAYLGIVICRAEMALLLLPATAAYLVSIRTTKPLLAFITVYMFALLIFFSSSYITNGGGLPGKAAGLQHKFLQLEGTRLPLDTLDASISSYINVFPQAISNTLVRPFAWETKGPLQLMAAVEIMLIWFLLLIVIFNLANDWKRRISHPVFLLLLFLSLSAFMAVGYTVPFPGAIIRYKAIPEMLLVCCLIFLYKKTN